MAKAAVTRSIRDDHQKNFLKIFNSLTGKHSRWEIWEDFVTLTAIEISNSTDKVNAPERTKMYQTIVSKYSAKEREGMAEMLAEVIMGMEQNPDQDFLGSLYMMCELGNDHAGQFFTPYDVCRCMAEITFDPKLHPDMEGFISVSDPACGAGATLLAFLNVCKRRNICYHNKVLVIAQDIDFIVGLMCYIQCSFMGCAGYVVIGDTLVNPATAYDSRGLLPAGPQNRIWYMLHKCWTGAYCRYFREAVLPLDPELQAALTTEGISPELRACAVCGKAFLPDGRQAYCSDVCKAEGNRRKSRERMRKMREKRPGGCYDLPPPKA